MSNDITTAERAIQALHDRLHSATRLSHENLARGGCGRARGRAY